MDQAGQHGWATDDADGYDLGIAGFEQLLNRLEGFAVDDRRDGNGNNHADWLQFLGLGAGPVAMALRTGQRISGFMLLPANE
ncbi:hypothetical protein SAMN02746000_03768 [Paracoccus sp. J56]|nr:hypothetical protein SAMN02746000_03768 [Paracoccus sp. J56]